MIWIFALLFTATIVEIFVRLPLKSSLSAINDVASKSFYLVRSESISDHWKEKAMAAYARSMFLATLKLGFLLLVVLIAGSLLLLLAGFFGLNLWGFLLSWLGILFSVVVAFLYLSLRKLIAKKRLQFIR